MHKSFHPWFQNHTLWAIDEIPHMVSTDISQPDPTHKAVVSNITEMYTLCQPMLLISVPHLVQKEVSEKDCPSWNIINVKRIL